MLRVGLTGGLGSGKSTVAKLFAAHGAQVLQSDGIGRQLMEPGQPVYAEIVAHFGNNVVLGGRLNRSALARLAFAEGRAEELNAIVHPAVIARQRELIEDIARRNPAAVVLVESALIFEAAQGGATELQQRFDRMILVTAPEDLKIARFVRRCFGDGEITEERKLELETEARLRLARQIPDDQKIDACDYILTNDGAMTELEWQVDQLWPILRLAAR
ncbi:MAG: dephospho-CoA kinase [Edaphobacter sp.]